MTREYTVGNTVLKSFSKKTIVFVLFCLDYPLILVPEDISIIKPSFATKETHGHTIQATGWKTENLSATQILRETLQLVHPVF